MHFSAAQIITEPDPSIRFDKSKGIIILYPSTEGSFYLNDYYLTELKAHDTVYLVNVTPRNYTVRFACSASSHEQKFKVDKRNVVEIILETDSLSVRSSVSEWDNAANRFAGKTVYYGKKGCFYNITHVSIFSLGNLEPYHKVSAFNSLTTINGFSVEPGFCIGMGITYNNYDISSDLKDISFLPVFLDIRSHFHHKRVAPFIKMDIGYNFLLSGKGDTDWHGTLEKGGLFLSPGLGLRIFINDHIQITTSIEYSLEKVLYSYQGTQYTYQNNLKFLKINLGIGFQKKLK